MWAATNRRFLLILVGLGIVLVLYISLMAGYMETEFWQQTFQKWRPSGGHLSGGGGELKDSNKTKTKPQVLDDPDYFWRKVPTHYPVPVESIKALPTGKPLNLPKVQASFDIESVDEREVRLRRKAAVQDAFKRSWDAYAQKAWLADELTPISGSARNKFGGWAATLVDNLDTLHIMGFQKEFEKAVSAAVSLDFTKSTMDRVNMFETIIRYLGGFLAAYDLSGDPRLLKKAREVGDMIYVVFDTPNRMPIMRWDFRGAAAGQSQVADTDILIAELGSCSMELTRLSQLTGDPRWFDAAERVTEAMRSQQNQTELPGMWPIHINARDLNFTADHDFSLGAMADSAFEYLPKMVALTGGLLPHYSQMYEDAMRAAIKHNFFRPMTPDGADLLLSSDLRTTRRNGSIVVESHYQSEHLVCFAGGMLALGGKLLGLEEHMKVARKLTDGCTWVYKSIPAGIMPEKFRMLPCEKPTSSNCTWDERRWKQAVLAQAGENSTEMARADEIITEKHLPKGITKVVDYAYLLRPEAIESVFVLYRTTGDRSLLDTAWRMFEAIYNNTKTDIANAELTDVGIAGVDTPKKDSMESFWMGETLKYFYLIFSEPDVISLDVYVLNTEAHPFKRPVP